MYRINRSPQMKDPETGKKKSHSVDLAEIDVNGSVIAGRSWSAVKKWQTVMTSNLPESLCYHKANFQNSEIKV